MDSAEKKKKKKKRNAGKSRHFLFSESNALQVFCFTKVHTVRKGYSVYVFSSTPLVYFHYVLKPLPKCIIITTVNLMVTENYFANITEG